MAYNRQQGGALDNGVLTKQGGVIGIGKTKKLSDDLNTDYFTYSSKGFKSTSDKRKKH